MTALDQAQQAPSTPSTPPAPTAEPAPSGLHPGLDQRVVTERRRALRALLMRPLLTAHGPDPESFGLVRRHAPWLREWLARHPGWSLHVDGELARLRKVPAGLTDGTRPARARRGDPAFSRRRYALLCLACAALAQADRQIALGRLAEQIVTLVATDPALEAAGLRFELAGVGQRRDLVAVVRLLMEYRVLLRVQGEEQAYLDERGDVLYTINRPALTAVLSVRRGPSSIEADDLESRLAAMTTEPVPDTDEGRNRHIRSLLVRRLLDDPVVFYDELDDDELAYLTHQRGRLLTELTEATGLHAEVRREGIALVDDRGDLTDVGLPEEGTDGHLTLLLAEHLAEHARRAPGVPVSRVALHRHVAELIARHAGRWRKGITQPGADIDLAEQTLDRLEALRLVRRTAHGVVPSPAVARYALAVPTTDKADLLEANPS